MPFHLIDTNGFHTKAEKENFQSAVCSACRESLKVSNFHRLADYVKQLPKMGVPHAPHDYCSSFDQSDHCFVTLSLPSSFLKLRNNDVIIEGKKTNRKPYCIYPVRFFSLIYTTMIEKKHSMSFENTNQRALYDVTST